MAMAGTMVYFIASLAGLIMIGGFSAWWLLMNLTERTRHRLAQASLRAAHEIECAQMDEEYAERVQPIRKINEKILNRWREANAAELTKHAAVCRRIDDENRKYVAAWEAAKAAILAEDYRLTQEIIRSNRCVLAEWEANNNDRHALYEQERREVELDNQRLMSQWNKMNAAQEAAYRHRYDEIEAGNQRVLNDWRVANAPWIRELTRWQERQVTAESKVVRMEQELLDLSRANLSRFQQRKNNAERVLQSHGGTLQDYEQELHRAQINSEKIQLENYLDQSLIRNAKLKGITGDRILSLESFGIETAHDVALLGHHKVPGIGPVLSQRLFDWRDNLRRKFRPKHGLPESERQRVANRFAPALLPLTQLLQETLNELEAIVKSHRAAEAQRLEAIATAVQEHAVAEAYVNAMKEV
jgi:hypothetical protein